jgi:hypothetical protein
VHAPPPGNFLFLNLENAIFSTLRTASKKNLPHEMGHNYAIFSLTDSHNSLEKTKGEILAEI